MSYLIQLPSIMHIGAGSSGQLAEVLANLNCSKPLMITDPMMVELGYAASIVKLLDEAGVDCDYCDQTLPEPTVASLQPSLEMLKAGNYDCLVALGGGSPIDTAKALSVLHHFGGEMRDYKVPRSVDQLGLPVIAIPTTAGTGSEATRFTVITDETTDEKMLCAGAAFLPRAALVDYELTLTVPPRTTADTAIDALTHAIEAYVSKKANAFSDQQALAAMSLIAPNLRKVYSNGNDRQAREAVMLGATLAGMAFSNASVALVHGMSRPIGAFFHVPHGLSNAMLLPAVTEYSIPAAVERYADCARQMGVAQKSHTDDEANDLLLDELRALNTELAVPTPSEYGISRQNYLEVVSIMAAQAEQSGSPANNPRVPTQQDMIELYRSVIE